MGVTVGQDSTSIMLAASYSDRDGIAKILSLLIQNWFRNI